jgi:hypothetical protein
MGMLCMYILCECCGLNAFGSRATAARNEPQRLFSKRDKAARQQADAAQSPGKDGCALCDRLHIQCLRVTCVVWPSVRVSDSPVFPSSFVGLCCLPQPTTSPSPLPRHGLLRTGQALRTGGILARWTVASIGQIHEDKRQWTGAGYWTDIRRLACCCCCCVTRPIKTA